MLTFVSLSVLLQAQATMPVPSLTVYVASEAVDNVSRVHFGPEGNIVEKVIPVDPRPSETDGPHNLNISPDGKYWYVSVAHGTPNGTLWKFDLGPDTLLGIATLSRFPATISFSPDGDYAWVANFNLYGDMVPSSISVVYTPAMSEIARIPTCLMPHGMRLNRQGTRAYMTCMMDDKVVEIDPASYAITRVLSVKPSAERVTTTSSAMAPGELDHKHATMSHDAPGGAPSPSPAPATCAPTWVQPSPDGTRLYVACNRHAEVLELDAATLMVTRRIATGKTPYNLAISADGRTLLATLKGVQALSVIDLGAGKEVAQLPTSHTIPSGVQITIDGRYAVVSQEGKAAEAGAVDLFDLPTRSRIGTVQVGAGAGGVQISER
ncbi:MAG: YncE family protein [Gemmatimonadota bacterium]